VLILGRFTEERKLVLDALREELRQRCYLPILFDFEKPRWRSAERGGRCLRSALEQIRLKDIVDGGGFAVADLKGELVDRLAADADQRDCYDVSARRRVAASPR
jgi:hypothetical protein